MRRSQDLLGVLLVQAIVLALVAAACGGGFLAASATGSVLLCAEPRIAWGQRPRLLAAGRQNASAVVGNREVPCKSPVMVVDNGDGAPGASASAAPRASSSAGGAQWGTAESGTQRRILVAVATGAPTELPDRFSIGGREIAASEASVVFAGDGLEWWTREAVWSTPIGKSGVEAEKPEWDAPAPANGGTVARPLVAATPAGHVYLLAQREASVVLSLRKPRVHDDQDHGRAGATSCSGARRVSADDRGRVPGVGLPP